ncbi:hypothetical protein JRQ81_003571 [Phrynocephalus forsythii]|uniref:Uncharacterized protein n=1 Tax=Phrynocephalus forsythii TaxID=171643 RepID=A0A9Q0XK49_9SAUR|nr:hypothetical protein JRQ81_003571 [Phrynocephalus forsythii]
MLHVGQSSAGSVCYPKEHQLPSILLQGQSRPQLQGRCSSNPLGIRAALCISPYPSSTQGSYQDFTGKTLHHPDSSLVAKTTMVHSPAQRGTGILTSSEAPEFTVPSGRPDRSPRHSLSPTHGLEDQKLIDDIFASSGKPSMPQLYHYKWKRFLSFTTDKGFSPVQPSLPHILQYL